MVLLLRPLAASRLSARDSRPAQRRQRGARSRPVAAALREGMAEWVTPDGVYAPASTWIVTADAPRCPAAGLPTGPVCTIRRCEGGATRRSLRCWRRRSGNRHAGRRRHVGNGRSGEELASARLPQQRAADHPRRLSRAADPLQRRRCARHDVARLAGQGAAQPSPRYGAELRRQLPRPDARDLRGRQAEGASRERPDRTDQPAHPRLPRLAGSQPRQRLPADRTASELQLRIRHPQRPAGRCVLVSPTPAHVRRAADLRRARRSDRAGGRLDTCRRCATSHSAGSSSRTRR